MPAGLIIGARNLGFAVIQRLADDDWSPARLMPCADERSERMRRVRFRASLEAALACTFSPGGAARRGAHASTPGGAKVPVGPWSW